MSSTRKALVVTVAGAALFLFAGLCQARAQGPYDFAGGRWYADEARDLQKLGFDVGGSNRVRQSRSYYYAAEESEYSAAPNTAQVRVIVPTSDAKVWFDESPTRQRGRDRLFESPELKPGRQYSYDIKAQWKENGRDVSRVMHVGVRANAFVTVDFGHSDG
jgi:uncharacterized protein (TIGR03000 family)